MKRTVVIMLSLAMLSGIVLATRAVVYSSENGKVPFSHDKHREILGDCGKCHVSKPPVLDREWGHKTCLGSHGKMKRGPVACESCHGKRPVAPSGKD